MLMLVLFNGSNMINNHKPSLTSVELSVNKEQTFKMKELNQIHFALLDYKDKYYSLQETKPYLDFRIVYNRYVYQMDDDTGKFKETKNTTYSQLKDCTKENFDGSDDERKYWNLTAVR